ncbi:hypothetical protein HYFRA_00007980 [Hymenoscyphus fraxineus]|uniref:non-specific serine/threonine protein kinase n=1 Tax=Hymenoscyphus fraxineus TaxID=746836 RepID=A0A9N9PQ65_9HELO|nr:hypothetical protein HYFRA_00007980 [Hymenoscyphus fraxineus]
MSVNQRYVPRNANEEVSSSSSIQVLRVTDGAQYLASKIPEVYTKDVPIFSEREERTNGYFLRHKDEDGADSDASYDSEEEDAIATYKTKTAQAIIPVAGIPISRILNHPNIVSLVDIVQNSLQAGNTSLIGGSGDVTIWEDMDAGSLSYIVPLANGLPALDDKAAWEQLTTVNSKRPALPEGLCWHVLRSMARALIWLHHGIKETAGVPGEWEKRDQDWQPVLIRDISPSQVWFKKPDGKKGYDYGECKLGGFKWAKVCGTVGGRLAVSERVPNTPEYKQLYWPPEIYRNTHPWTRATEIWQLGATVYTMMCGHPPSRYSDYQWNCSRMTDAGYSDFLTTVVRMMLKDEPGLRPDALTLVNKVDFEYWQWRDGTKLGQEYVDKDDEKVKKASNTKGKGGLRNLEGAGFQGV